MRLPRFSMGVGDRFGQQGEAQLKPFIKAKEAGIDITPIWNKSHREHSIVGTRPMQVKLEADCAVKALDWDGPYFVDADHIGLHNVDLFLESSNFYTLDVSEFIGRSVASDDIDRFNRFLDQCSLTGTQMESYTTKDAVSSFGEQYLAAVKEAQRIYGHLEQQLGRDRFITEISLDEAQEPQSPQEIFLLLAALAFYEIPAQTIAPKFTGAFNKGVDYIGEVSRFAKEFEENLQVIRFSVNTLNLPSNIKLSVHSGSDKFSIYSIIRDLIAKYNAGVHLKTAGTTWLEELIGLALSGGDGLSTAKEIYAASLARYDELCAPYESVLDINRTNLPTPGQVNTWDGQRLAETLRHDQTCKAYSKDFRQLLHVGYKIAAEMGDRYLTLLQKHAGTISKQVEENIYERHMKRVFF